MPPEKNMKPFTICDWLRNTRHQAWHRQRQATRAILISISNKYKMCNKTPAVIISFVRLCLCVNTQQHILLSFIWVVECFWLCNEIEYCLALNSSILSIEVWLQNYLSSWLWHQIPIDVTLKSNQWREEKKKLFSLISIKSVFFFDVKLFFRSQTKI